MVRPPVREAAGVAPAGAMWPSLFTSAPLAATTAQPGGRLAWSDVDCGTVPNSARRLSGALFALFPKIRRRG